MKDISILIGSDVCTDHQREYVNAATARKMLSELKQLFAGADYRLANLECVLGEEGTGAPILKTGPNLLGYPENVSIFTELGIDCAILANNHTGDYGDEGMISTLKILADNRIAPIGGGRDLAEAYAARYFKKDGVKIAFLAVCENEFGCAGENKPGAAGFSAKRLADRIAEERALADFVVVIFHGGNEHDPVPSPDTVERYRLILDLGADALVAMHTHCMQGYEFYKNKPIIYSMGNFLFYEEDAGSPQESASWYHGYLTELRFEKGAARPVDFVLHPYVFTADGSKVKLLSGEKKEAVLRYLEKLSAPIADPARLSHLFDAWCLGAGKGYASHLGNYCKACEQTPIPEADRHEQAEIRNLFTCEAHSSLIRNLMRMENEGRMQEAEAWLDDLNDLKKIPEILI